MPRLPFVSWNSDVALDAIKALNEAARKLRLAAEERERHAKQAATEWTGPYRQDFDVHYHRAVHEELELAEAYSLKARVIEHFNEQARELSKERQANRRNTRGNML